MIKNQKVGSFGLFSEAPAARQGRKGDKSSRKSNKINPVILMEAFLSQYFIGITTKYPLKTDHLLMKFLPWIEMTTEIGEFNPLIENK